MTKKERDVYVKNSQFYTKPDTAKEQINRSIKFLQDNELDINKVLFIEPSAGSGNFYFNLPNNVDKLAFDLFPVEGSKNWCKEQDFLQLKDIETDKEILFFIGNPPFNDGLALDFINHIFQSWQNKNIIVGFILPGGYNIDNSVNRVKKINESNNINLFVNDKLKNDSFVFPNGDSAEMVTVYQIYSNMKNLKAKPFNLKEDKKDISEWVNVVHINSNPIKKTRWIKDEEGKRVWEYVKNEKDEFVYITTGVKFINELDCYLPMNTYESQKDKFYVYDTYEECGNKIGYGFIIKKDKVRVKKILKSTNWYELTHQLTNMSQGISKKRIVNYLYGKLNEGEIK